MMTIILSALLLIVVGFIIMGVVLRQVQKKAQMPFMAGLGVLLLGTAILLDTFIPKDVYLQSVLPSWAYNGTVMIVASGIVVISLIYFLYQFTTYINVSETGTGKRGMKMPRIFKARSEANSEGTSSSTEKAKVPVGSGAPRE